MPRSYIGTGSASQPAMLSGLPVFVADDGTSLGLGQVGSSTFNGPDGGVFVAPIFIGENITGVFGNVRGRLRGMWDWGHGAGVVVDGDTHSGTGALAAKTFRAFKATPYIETSGAANATGILVGETSDTWETN
jgi:hypothetical protein